MSLADALKQSTLFHDFTSTGLGILASIAVERAIPSGTPLFAEDMVGDSMLIISSGRVKIGVKGTDGRELQLGTLGPGAHLGELSLLSVGKRLCSATAETEVKVVEIRRADFTKLQQTKPQACLKLMMNIASELGGLVAENREAFRGLVAQMGR